MLVATGKASPAQSSHPPVWPHGQGAPHYLPTQALALAPLLIPLPTVSIPHPCPLPLLPTSLPLPTHPQPWHWPPFSSQTAGSLFPFPSPTCPSSVPTGPFLLPTHPRAPTLWLKAEMGSGDVAMPKCPANGNPYCTWRHWVPGRSLNLALPTARHSSPAGPPGPDGPHSARALTLPILPLTMPPPIQQL